VATVRETRAETPRAATVAVDVPAWPGHLAGQHVDVRLTAEDGYQAQRSYSIASAPEDDSLELTVERIDDGEVSPYLVDELRPGDQFELRGPIGGYFTWHAGLDGALLLVGGGSGVVPLRCMLRHRRAAGGTGDARLLLSARGPDEVLYRTELDALAGDGVKVDFTFTREPPPGWNGFARRIDADMLAAVGPGPGVHPRVYLCGPTPFVERAADLLVDLGHDPSMIKAERFGPTGG
jgi:ferredoxin-NADP reductase